MKLYAEGEMASEIDNSIEFNNNGNKTEACDIPEDSNNISSHDSSVLSPCKSSDNGVSSPIVKTPTHFHHPEYIQEAVDNRKPRIVESSRQVVVNVHPDSGVDRSSFIENDQANWPPPSSYTRPWCLCSWYSRWEDRAEEAEMERMERIREEKQKRNVDEIRKLPCSLGKMVLQEQEKLEANQEQQGLDPRLASRSPSASNPLYSKPRYKSPVNSSPSRMLKDVREQTTSVQSLTMQRDDNMNVNSNYVSSHENHIDNGTFIVVNKEKMSKGVSMPEIAHTVKLFPYHILSTLNPRLPKGVDRTRLEQHLTYKEFQHIFGMSRDEFWRLPKWKKMDMKKKVHLF